MNNNITNLKDAVENTPALNGCFKDGNGAMKEQYKRKVSFSKPRLVAGSIDIDTSMKRMFPGDNRWDYAIEYNGEMHYIEVHRADIHKGYQDVVNKLKWLQHWLQDDATCINNLPHPKRYHWVSTGEVAQEKILYGSTQSKKRLLTAKKHLSL